MNEVPTFQPLAHAPLPDYVRPGEELVWRGKPTLSLLVSQGLGLLGTFFVLSIFMLGAAASGRGEFLAFLPVVLLFLLVLILVLQSIRLRRTEFVVTRQSIYTRTGIIGQTVIQTTYDKITDISLKQDVLGRILGFSSLNVNTAGSNTAPVRMDGLRGALEVKSLVEAARESFLRGGQGATPARGGLPVPRFVPARLLVRVVCPTTRRPFRRPRTEAGTRAPCPHCPKTHLVAATEGSRGRAGPA